jgi:hypothetical protein
MSIRINQVLNKRTSLVIILIITVITVIDSTLVDFSTYTGIIAPLWLYSTIFLVLFTTYVVISSMLLDSCFKIIPRYEFRTTPIGLRYFRGTVLFTQSLTIGIILIIALQMLLLNEYDVILLRIETLMTHISAAVFISFLTFLLAGWLMARKSYSILLYTVSFLLVAISIVITLIYLDLYLYAPQSNHVRWYSITTYVTNTMPPDPSLTEPLSLLFDILTLSSFLAMWIATAILLKEYRHKIGRFKFFFVMCLPLIYYIFPFQAYFGDVFFSYLQSSPVVISIIYILIFSATRQGGSLLFSLAFWTASSLVYDNRVRQSLLISAVGMSALFSSVEISSVRYHTYPPFGLVTEAFLPLGAILLSIGIYTSAKKISQDALLRKEFYKSASSQLSLLKAIGVSQMEKEFADKIKSVERRVVIESVELDAESEHNAKEILREVLNELYYSKPRKNSHKT